MIKTPIFWYDKSFISKLKTYLLSPLSIIWIIASRIKIILSHPYKSKLKVICIGNLTIGGTGKTPFAISTFKWLKDLGYNPVFLTRGYGGKQIEPMEVKTFHKHKDVGDEALLLSKIGTTIVSKNRSSGAKFIESHQSNFDIVIMDDGLQNNQLHKNFNILLVDKNLMFGNELCIPAGPLRETISSGLLNIDAIILTGNNEKIDYNHYIFIKEIPIFESVISLQKIFEANQDKFLAFCGLGNPHKFYKTLKQNGFNLIQKKSFPDHYQYNDSDINNLRQEAKKYKLKLITTEKDYVKINEHNNTLINVASINITMEDKQLVKFKALIKESIDG